MRDQRLRSYGMRLSGVGGRPWIGLGDDPLAIIRALHDAFVRTLETPGLISVDQADLEAALSFGGEIKVYLATGPTPDLAVGALMDILRVRRPSQPEAPPAACCVQMRLPSSAGMAAVDQIVQTIESSRPCVFDDKTLVVLAAHQEARSDVLVRLVTIQGRGQ